MPRSFTQRFDMAGQAIADVFTTAYPEAAYSWPNIKPYADTGMNVPAWLATADDILDRLQAIAGAPKLQVPKSVLREHGSDFLYKFQLYLASVLP